MNMEHSYKKKSVPVNLIFKTAMNIPENSPEIC